MSPIQRQSSKQ